jgi:hypothetical protein
LAKGKSQIAFYGTEDYRFYLQDEARKRRVKVQQLLEKAVDSYLTKQAPSSFSAATSASSPTDRDIAYTSAGASENEHYHEMLDRILNAGGTYRATIIATLEGWSRAVRLEDRESEITGNPETEQGGAAGALAYANSALERAKADREGTLGNKKPPAKRVVKRGNR